MNTTTITTKRFAHYYGDVVRLLFMLAAIIMLLELPALNQQVGIPTGVSVVSILILGLAAGLTNPKLIWEAEVNTAISIIAFGVFETYAVIAYRESENSIFFMVNLILGLVCLAAVYFSVKTVRGLILEEREDKISLNH